GRQLRIGAEDGRSGGAAAVGPLAGLGEVALELRGRELRFAQHLVDLGGYIGVGLGGGVDPLLAQLAVLRHGPAEGDQGGRQQDERERGDEAAAQAATESPHALGRLALPVFVWAAGAGVPQDRHGTAVQLAGAARPPCAGRLRSLTSTDGNRSYRPASIVTEAASTSIIPHCFSPPSSCSSAAGAVPPSLASSSVSSFVKRS